MSRPGGKGNGHGAGRRVYVLGDDHETEGVTARAGTTALVQFLKKASGGRRDIIHDPSCRGIAPHSVVLLHDTGNRNGFPIPDEVRSLIANSKVQVILNITRGRSPQGSGIDMLTFDKDLLQLLKPDQRRVAVVLSLTTARSGGAAIGRCLSVENAVEDYSAERALFAPLRELVAFRHLFITAGTDGLVHIRSNLITESESPSDGRVYFDPYHDPPPPTDSSAERDMRESAALIAALLTDPDEKLWPRNERRHAKSPRLPAESGKPSGLSEWRALAACLPAIKAANDEQVDKGKKGPIGKFPPQKEFRSVEIPQYLLAPPLPGRLRSPTPWRILDDGLRAAPIHRVNVAMAIVYAGVEHVLNKTWSSKRILDNADKGDAEARAERDIYGILARGEVWNPEDRAPDYVTLEVGDHPALPPLKAGRTSEIIGETDEFEVNVPIVAIGDLMVAERDAIERLRSIRNLLKHYITSTEDQRPISIAVFGPPGSGKSFSVKQICKALDSGNKISTFELNLSQYQEPRELSAELKEIFKIAQDKIPLVFFDEFDSGHDGKPLGWLKYFLAPMWDGTFQGHDNRKFEKAIFVFAGGISGSFEQFIPRAALPDEERGLEVSSEHKERLQLFKDQKGPDFVSRLAGHINVLPINEEPGRIKHFIRRAIQLRSLLERNKLTNKAPEAKDGKGPAIATVDLAIIYALLTIDQYNHGVRSMESIIRMCAPVDKRIEITSLPSRAQLNMHVDAEEFFRRIYRGRARISQEPTERIVATRRVAVALRKAREGWSSPHKRALAEAVEELNMTPSAKPKAASGRRTPKPSSLANAARRPNRRGRTGGGTKRRH